MPYSWAGGLLGSSIRWWVALLLDRVAVRLILKVGGGGPSWLFYLAGGGGVRLKQT